MNALEAINSISITFSQSTKKNSISVVLDAARTIAERIASAPKFEWLRDSAYYYPEMEQSARSAVLLHLREIAVLPENWDGYGAADIPAETIGIAEKIIGRVSRLPTEVVPHPAGTVMLEWESAQGRAYIEVGLTLYNFYVKPRGGKPSALVGPIEHLKSGINNEKILSMVQAIVEYPAKPSQMTRIEYESRQVS